MRLMMICVMIVNLPLSVWALTISDNIWTQMTPTGTTNAEYESYSGNLVFNHWNSATYDTENHRILWYDVFSDGTGTECESRRTAGIYANALWAWDLTENSVSILSLSDWYWDNTSYRSRQCENAVGPVNRHPTLVYAKGHVYLLPGLNSKDETDVGIHPDDLWKFNLSEQRWSEITYGSPAPGYTSQNQAATMPDGIYDAANDRIVMFSYPSAGSSTQYTWYWDPDDDVVRRWSGTQPVNGATGEQLAYDSRRARVWKFGGGDYNSGSNDLFWLDASAGTWHEVSESNVPPGPRQYHMINYDSKNDVLFVYGGRAGYNGAVLTDTWVYAPLPNAWQQIATSGATASNQTNGEYDPENDAHGLLCGAEEFWTYRYVPYNHDTLAHATSPLPQPNAGEWTLDPDFGGWFLRLADMRSNNGFVFHPYSDLQALSRDATYIVVQNNSGMQIWRLNTDMAGYTVHDDSPGIDNDCFWAPNDNNILYYISGSALMRYDASTLSTSTVVDMAEKDGWSSVEDSLIKPCSNNGRYFVLAGMKSGEYVVTRYDKRDDVIGAVIVKGPDGGDVETWISPDGDYLIQNWRSQDVSSWNPVTGDKVADLTGENSPHADVIKDAGGTQWLVYTAGSDCTIKKVRMDGTETTTLFQPGVCVHAHISARHVNMTSGKDWVILSTYTVTANRSDGMDAFEDEIIRLYLDSTASEPHFERILKHRSTYYDGAVDHYCQPHASVSPDGNWLVYGSDYGATGNNADDTSGNGVEIYVAWLPPSGGAAAARYGLDVNVIGQGSVDRHPDGDSYAPGTQVTVSAQPTASWQFDHWTGNVADTGSATTTITMAANESVTATFVEASPSVTYDLDVTISGEGNVIRDPQSDSYAHGTQVTLVAQPEPGWQFGHWTGNVADETEATTTCVINTDETVSATFVKEENSGGSSGGGGCFIHSIGGPWGWAKSNSRF